MTIAEEKAILRKKLRQQMRELPEICSQEEKFITDIKLHRRVEEHPWMLEADVVLTYCSTKEEPDTRGIIGWLLYTGRRVALPVCVGNGEMVFYLLGSLEELRPGRFGILEPSGREEPVVTEKTLCIVPGLAFTENGERLGQGGGYYDRFLQAHPGMRTMGMTYRRMLQEHIPCEIHDHRVGIVITEK